MARRGLTLDAETLAELRGESLWIHQALEAHERRKASKRRSGAKLREERLLEERKRVREAVARLRARRRAERAGGTLAA